MQIMEEERERVKREEASFIIIMNYIYIYSLLI
jgi:hypothetical protein